MLDVNAEVVPLLSYNYHSAIIWVGAIQTALLLLILLILEPHVILNGSSETHAYQGFLQNSFWFCKHLNLQ